MGTISKGVRNIVRFSALVLLVGLTSPTWADDIPDPTLTPGVARADITQEQICATAWGKDARLVTADMKRQVFANYGYTGNDDPRCVPSGNRHCEIDHLISRELGGADDIANLWPQAYGSQPWNADKKDALENRLHKEMCAGNVTLQEAQDMLVKDWREAYRKYYGER
jgi:hypothetical protein